MDNIDHIAKIFNKQIGLDEWLKLIKDDPRQAPFYGLCFPSDDFKREFLSNINNINRVDVYEVLKSFLLQSTTFPHHDTDNLNHLESILAQKEDPIEWLANHPYYMRLMIWNHEEKGLPPWEGITWVLELLPNHPKRAIEVIEHYLMAHFPYLPDWPITGMFDAITIIRAKFIGIPENNLEKIEFLLKRESREFECIIEQLYSRMGYKTSLTPATRDGGKDVIASRETPAQREMVAVECKLYNTTIGVEFVRIMRGVITYGGYNKGVIFTTKDFSPDAKKLAETDRTVELISGDKLVVLLNEYFGIDWPYHIDKIIFQSGRKHNPHN